MPESGGASEPAARPVILISGASAGLGETLARELVRRKKAGALVLTARRGDRLKSLERDLKSSDSTVRVLTLAADLADPATPDHLVAATTDRFGGLDVLVNNAGFGLPTLFADADPRLVAEQIEVNFRAPLLLTRLCLPSLIARQGMIINIGSAITCVANSALGAYGATKAGLAYWNDALRRELRSKRVKVCLVEPGPIKTEFMDAISARVAAGGRPHPILENAAPWMSAKTADVACRVADLLDRPRRRLSVPRRFVWPFRTLGALTRLCPPLGDRLVVALSKDAS
jgi:short-subunit dehydrogenase